MLTSPNDCLVLQAQLRWRNAKVIHAILRNFIAAKSTIYTIEELKRHLIGHNPGVFCQ
jgi:hypothetical protein